MLKVGSSCSVKLHYFPAEHNYHPLFSSQPCKDLHIWVTVSQSFVTSMTITYAPSGNILSCTCCLNLDTIACWLALLFSEIAGNITLVMNSSLSNNCSLFINWLLVCLKSSNPLNCLPKNKENGDDPWSATTLTFIAN